MRPADPANYTYRGGRAAEIFSGCAISLPEPQPVPGLSACAVCRSLPVAIARLLRIPLFEITGQLNSRG